MTKKVNTKLVLRTRDVSAVNGCHIVIPTHKESLSGYEEIALINNLKILDNWPKTICLPFNISQDYYKKLAEDNHLDFLILNLPEGYLGSIENYNKLLLSPFLYEKYSDFKYILIAQVDVWIFRDELQYWIDKDFDYLGAPLFLPQNTQKKALKTLMLPYGGNGGLSLRNVEKTLELTRTPRRRMSASRVLVAITFLLRYQNWHYLNIFWYSLNQLWNNPKSFREKHLIYEDVMFSIFYAIYDRKYRVAPSKVSLGFSIEVHSSDFLDSFFGFTSPFGLHGYDKYLSKHQLDWLIKNSSLRSRPYFAKK
jgi:hypothetical protein